MMDHGDSNKWELHIDDDGLLTLPPDLLKAMGWKEGDELEWKDNGDGTWSLIKVQR